MMLHPKKILAQYGIDPKKSLGQNFLFDDGILTQIVRAGDVEASDHVLEIGPGVGALTHHLAQVASKVVAVELDNRLLPILQEELTPYDHVQLIHGDILEQNPSELFDQPYKVVANVPYYITGAILRLLVSAEHKPTHLVMTVQKEVAERVTAVPPHMSLLAVSTQYYGKAEFVDTIKAGAFWPRPDVDSAILRLTLAEALPLPLSEEKQFMRLVKMGFSQKRKQLQKNLRALNLERAHVMGALQTAVGDPSRRAQTLTITEWVALYKALYLTPS